MGEVAGKEAVGRRRIHPEQHAVVEELHIGHRAVGVRGVHEQSDARDVGDPRPVDRVGEIDRRSKIGRGDRDAAGLLRRDGRVDDVLPAHVRVVTGVAEGEGEGLAQAGIQRRTGPEPAAHRRGRRAVGGVVRGGPVRVGPPHGIADVDREVGGPKRVVRRL